MQLEFNLSEQISVVRDYVQENFVDRGMIADFSMHDNRNGNPHAHIMLTTRYVSSEGFGQKNTEWNRKSELYSWRKSWADVNNRMFECKGFEMRISHLSYKDQGLDKEPMVHLGYKAWALGWCSILVERYVEILCGGMGW